MRRTWLTSLLLFSGLLLVLPVAAQGQSQGGDDDGAPFFPRHGFLVTGYGSAGYRATLAAGSTPNDFKASLAPVFLWQISDRFLFEGELEFRLEEGVTEAELEYAQIDYSLTDNVKLVAGKFLLPFNVFTERMHPTWINSFVSPPPVYGGHHGGAGPAEALLPVLSDVGFQARSTFNLGRFGYLTASGFVTQGPRIEAEEGGGHGSEEAGTAASFRSFRSPGARLAPDPATRRASAAVSSSEEEHGHHVPEVVFGTNFEDNNEDKMVGGRIGGGIAPYFEVDVSAMTGEYDDAGDLRLTSYGAHAEGRYAGFELHGEWIRTEQQVADEETGEISTLTRDGYWAQLSYRYRKWEPQVRWGQLFEGDLHGETVKEDGEQLALGLAYWLEPSLGLKAEYLINYEDADLANNRLALQWAFGF